MLFAVGVRWYVFGTRFVGGVVPFAEYIMGYPVIVGVLDIALQGVSGNTQLGTTSIANKTLSYV